MSVDFGLGPFPGDDDEGDPWETISNVATALAIIAAYVVLPAYVLWTRIIG